MLRLIATISLGFGMLSVPLGALANSHIHTVTKVCKNGTCTKRVYNKTCVKGRCHWDAHSHTWHN